ncbi:hypothetical protein PMZ80_000903 [Knufia obscura]|uniref:Telomeric repeat-binding factor 2-interacting protein 1 n=1 Tax=Knufia obscura TaxID=1635080 RepID=A0ABR0S2M3_9EURO|nr:hypothetical protein PMZ80_000903 [Knufia obscura]
MPDDASPIPSQPGQLFSSSKFWLARKIPSRSELSKKLTSNGAVVVALEKQADYCLVDPNARQLPTGQTCYDYNYVYDSLNKNELQDLDGYVVKLPAATERPVGSRTLGAKSTKTRFTPQDDQLLHNWITPYRESGGSYKGNEIYQQLARKYPHHPFQSWRSRYLDYVQHDQLDVTEHVDAFAEIAVARAELAEQRPPKRRRLNDSRPANQAIPAARTAQTPEAAGPADAHTLGVPTTTVRQQVNAPPANNVQPDVRTEQTPPRDDRVNVEDLETASETNNEINYTEVVDLTPREARRQSLSVQTWRSMLKAHPTLSWTEADRLYKAVPYIYDSSPEHQSSCFQNMAMAGEWDRHSAAEWELYYHELILPEYIRRNGLRDDAELEMFIKDALVREAQRDQTPEIKKEPSPDPRTPAERQIDRERERARAETKDIAFSETSENSDPGDAFTADEEIPVAERQPSPTLEPPSPVAPRTEVHANEGRKRASQQTNSTQSESQPLQASQQPTSSPKKKLFGQTLSMSQTDTQAGTQTDLTGIEVNAGSTFQHSSASEGVDKAAVTSSLSSVPTVQKPPKSYQEPPKSASTSQESAQYDTAKQAQVPANGSTETSMTSIEKHVQERVRPPSPHQSSPVVDLLGDGELDNDEVRSEGGLSDTGSEFMAFDTAPERSQLWETNPEHAGDVQHQEADYDERSLEEESDETDDESTEPQDTDEFKRPPTPMRRKILSERVPDEGEEVENEPEAYSMQYEGPVVRDAAAKRIETQALFQHTENEASEFDLPPPEGGWEALGLEDVDDEDPDQPITTVELPDDHPLKRRASSTPSQTTESSSETDDRNSSPVVIPQPQEIHEISSDETQSTTDDDEEHVPAAPEPEPPGSPGSVRSRSASFASSTTTSSRRSNLTRRSVGSAGSDSLRNSHTLRNWLAAQKKHYDRLPELIFKRLASVAAQATCQDPTSATMLLRDLVEAFNSSEDTRRAKHEHIQSLRKRKDPHYQPLPFKAKNTITDTSAKTLLPADVMGIWTTEDDDDLLSHTSASIGRVEKKHTKSGVKKRAGFLQRRYGLVRDADNSAGPSASTTPARRTAKRMK